MPSKLGLRVVLRAFFRAYDQGATMSDDRGPNTKQPHAATIVQPKAPFGAQIQRPPHPATIVQPKPALSAQPTRSPHLAALMSPSGAAQRSTVSPQYANYTTFVIAPTCATYSGADSSDLATEFNDLKGMAEKDIVFLTKVEKANVYPLVIYTGYSGGQGNGSELSDCFDALSGLSKNTKINFVITAHGSPGIKGKVGMGDDAKGKFDYRLTAPMLVEVLKSLGIKKLKKLDLYFTFRSCNGAYVPLNRRETNLYKAKIAVIEQSFIGCFHFTMREKLKLDVTVTGFRGFYFPDHKAPKVSADRSTKFSLKEGSITILSNLDVEFGDETEIFKIQSTKLDDLF